MDDEFPSVVIGENTLIAIEDAEKIEKSHHVPIHGRKFGAILCNSSDDLSQCRGAGCNVQNVDTCHQKLTPCGLSGGADARTSVSAPNIPVNDSEDCKRYSKCTDQKPQMIEMSNLRDCGLPMIILKNYSELGIKSMFQWQYECVCNESVLSGKNLVYSAPTSAGKTLVAEILTIRSVFMQKKKAIIILPFISVVKEKTNYFQELMEGTGVRVEGFMGGYSPAGGFQHTDVAVCTIEKANSLIIRLMEDGNLSSLGIVVVDELHLLGDTHRGYLLELLLTKIRYMCLRDKINIQIVGMSATLPNLELLAHWLQAELYLTNFRPVPLRELIKLGKTIYDNNMKEVYKFNGSLPIKGDADDVTFLCLETIAQGFSVLIFCPTKNWCEKLAEAIAKDFFFIGTSSISMPKEGKELVEKFINELNKSPLSEVVDKLKRSPSGLDPMLAKTVLLGVAFHHAGLTMDERDVLESSFRAGALRVLVATSTLSSGVNLPARRVIVRTPIFHGKLVDILTYKQMIGRAGRMGVDTAGESILVCHEREKGMVERLLNSDLPPIQSCLGSGRSSKLSASLKRAIFEVVASGVASTPEQVERYTNLTLLAAIVKMEKKVDFQIQDPLKSCLKYLEESEFIRLEAGDSGEVRYVATHLGEACLAASLPPDQALSLFEELQRARKCFVLEDELHIIYQVTPFSVADQWGDSLDWLHLLNVWECLPSSLKRVGELVGIDERFIVRAMKGSINLRAPKQMEKMGIHRRFYTALALRELVNEVPINEVAQKYGCSRGMLQNLQQSAAIFAGMVTQFCRRLRWTGLELLASQLQDRLQFGIRGELCDLMRLPLLDGQCARALFDAGIESLAMLAADASPAKVNQALRTFIPFQSGKTEEDDPSHNGKKKKWISSMSSVRNLLEKNVAVFLIKEARKIIQKELGVADMKWNDDPEVGEDAIECQSPAKKDDSLHSSQSNLVILESPALSFKNDSANNPNGSGVCTNAVVGENPSHNNGSLTGERTTVEPRQLNNCQSVASSSVDESVPSFSGCDSSERCKHPSLNESKGRVSFSVPMTQMETRDNSVTSGPISPVVISSSPITSIMANQSGRSSISDFIGTKRTSLDIFSSPLADEMPSGNMSNQSPSLFGDSFTVDTQLENLMNGSSSSNKTWLQSTATDENQALLSCTSSHSSTPKLPVSGSASNRNTSTASKNMGADPPNPFQTINRLNFSKQSPVLRSLPQEKVQIIPETQEVSDTCPLGETVSPSKWDFGSMVKIEADFFDETYCENGVDSTCLKSTKGGVGQVACEGVEATKGSSSESWVENPSIKLLEAHRGVSARDFSNWDFREDVTLGKRDLDSRVESGEDAREMKARGNTEDEKCSLVVGGSNASAKGKRLSLEAVSCSFLEKAFVSAFDFEDELTMRVESSRGRVEGGEHIVGDEVVALACAPGAREEESGREGGWEGTHLENISLEAVHHSSIVLCPSSSEEDEEKDSVIMPSQASTTVKSITSLSENLDDSRLTKAHKDSSFIKFERQLVKNKDVCDNVGSTFSFRSCSMLKEESRNTLMPIALKRETLNGFGKNDAVPNGFRVIDVCEDVDVFKNFCDQFENQSRFSFSVALCDNFCDNSGCDKQESEDIHSESTNVGTTKISQKRKRPDAEDECGPFYFLGLRSLIDGNTVISGISFSWQSKSDCAFFLPLYPNNGNGKQCTTPTGDDKIMFLKKVFKSKKRTCIALYIKEHLRTLSVACGIDMTQKTNFWDPKIADWLLDPDGKEKNLRSMCISYCPGVWKSIESCGGSLECARPWSLGMDTRSSLSPHLRSSIEAVVALEAMATLESLLHKQNLLSIFADVEMPVTCCLVEMEAFGIGFCESQGIHTKSVLASRMRELEKKAYSLAGHSFRLSSPKEVGKVLYQELRLPWKDPKVCSSFKGKKRWSTSKETLERLVSIHPLPRIIIEWRKLSSILSKTVLPLLRCCQRNRIYGSHITHTSTGRISMHEPNLQNIPRDFELSSLASDSSRGYLSDDCGSKVTLPSEGNSLSIRHCFTPAEGSVYLSADYSQLELRLIAHMSRDQRLCSILNEGCDVFCQIASTWKCIDVVNVTPNLRQQAKGICYGMLYGIGTKALAEQLGVDEFEASNFMESFKNAFPAHAERQAINTLVQGSAADLVKAAMVRIDEVLHVKSLSLSSRIFKHAQTSSDSRFKRPRVNGGGHADSSSVGRASSGAFLVLHLHDELLYEVSVDALESVAAIVKSEMEDIWKLKVRLPVNLKVGKSWGALSSMRQSTQKI